MTGKERINAALHFQPVDRVPVAVLDGGVWIASHAGLTLAELLALDDCGARLLYDNFTAMNSDIIYTGAGLFAIPLAALGAKALCSKRGQAVEIKPVSADPEYFKDFDITSIRALLLTDPYFQALIKQTRLLRRMVKDQYLSTLTMAPFTIAGQLIGVQNLMTALYDEDVDLQPLFNVAERLCTEVNNLLLIAGADMVALADPVASGALISQEMFEQYALPRLRSVLPQLARPEQVLLHICGNTTARLDSLSHLGINAFSLDDVNLNTALAAAQGHFAVMGNLSPFAVMASKPAAEVKLLAARCCAAAGKNGGFILAPGCDLPSATPLENIQALTAGALGAGQLLNSY